MFETCPWCHEDTNRRRMKSSRASKQSFRRSGGFSFMTWKDRWILMARLCLKQAIQNLIKRKEQFWLETWMDPRDALDPPGDFVRDIISSLTFQDAKYSSSLHGPTYWKSCPSTWTAGNKELDSWKTRAVVGMWHVEVWKFPGRVHQADSDIVEAIFPIIIIIIIIISSSSSSSSIIYCISPPFWEDVPVFNPFP